jgi:hypothetical protein
MPTLGPRYSLFVHAGGMSTLISLTSKVDGQSLRARRGYIGGLAKGEKQVRGGVRCSILAEIDRAAGAVALEDFSHRADGGTSLSGGVACSCLTILFIGRVGCLGKSWGGESAVLGSFRSAVLGA